MMIFIKVDVRRFLNSLMNVYKDVIPFRSEWGSKYLMDIYEYVNTGPYYIGKFKEAIIYYSNLLY